MSYPTFEGRRIRQNRGFCRVLLSSVERQRQQIEETLSEEDESVEDDGLEDGYIDDFVQSFEEEDD